MLDQTTNLEGLDVTITTTMQVLAVVVALMVQFVKALLSRWPILSDEAKKALFPLLSVGFTMGLFYLSGTENWLIASIVTGLTASGGYSVFSGANKLTNGKLKKVTPILVLAGLVTLSGCANLIENPRGELLAYQKTFTATVNTLSDLKEAGKINDVEAVTIGVLIHQGQTYLDEWHKAVLAGQSRPDVITSFKGILNQLILIEQSKRKTPTS